MTSWRSFVTASIGLAMFQLLIGTSRGAAAGSGLLNGAAGALQRWVDPNTPLLPTPSGASSRLTVTSTTVLPTAVPVTTNGTSAVAPTAGTTVGTRGGNATTGIIRNPAGEIVAGTPETGRPGHA